MLLSFLLLCAIFVVVAFILDRVVTRSTTFMPYRWHSHSVLAVIFIIAMAWLIYRRGF